MPDQPISETERLLLERPLVAILRGVTPDEVIAIGDALFEAGFRVIEVPLNSPEPYESIRRLASHFGSRCLIGAGTVTRAHEVTKLYEAGGQLVVSPCTEPQVIALATRYGMLSLPGVATPTDVFTAINKGARYLKLFPAATYGPSHLKAMNAVVPEGVKFLAVGGVGAETMDEWVAAGCVGFGLGSDLYKPGMTAADVSARAAKAVAAFDALRAG